MIVYVGTTSEQKINHLKNELLLSFNKIEIHAFDVASDVSDQPVGLKETTEGAKNRAKKAWDLGSNNTGAIAIGMEAGFMIAGDSVSLVCVSGLYDGNVFYIGTSGTLSIPMAVYKEVLNNKQFGDAIRSYKISDNDHFTGSIINELIQREISFRQSLRDVLNKYLSNTTIPKPDL